MRYINIFFLIIAVLVGACSGSKKLTQAKKSFSIGEYTRAAELYKKAYAKEKNRYYKGEYAWYMGESYRITNKPLKAASAYSKAVRYEYPEREAQFYMAESYRKAGKLDKAIPEYEEYLEKVPADIRAQRGLASCMMLQKEPQPNRYIIAKEKDLNSKYSDYSPTYAGTEFDYVVFASMRVEGKSKRKNRITGQGTSSIFYSKKNAKGAWEDPAPFEEPINNPKFDDGSPFVSHDGKELFFTRCKFDNEKPTGAEVVSCKRQGGQWGEPINASLALDSTLLDSTVIAHPALSADGETLYFVSDMEGGYGGKDIWKAEKAGEGQWGEPINMGSAINTPGNEMFPFIRKDGILYFSSDTHIGFGGLDLFKAELNEEGNWDVTNMGEPINSIGDDFGIVFQGKDEVGLFSSSRGSTKGIDNIYSFVLPKLNFYLTGLITNNNEEIVTGSYLRLIGSDGTTMKVKSPSDGKFKVKLKPNTDYVFLVAAEGYLNKKVKFSTSGEVNDKSFEYNIVMEKPLQKVN
ncbi:tetratricopeptide repeat protein [Saccharicrinis aurantiacus]|uniref:tetratricopeptide repeat protein n=1 Tax=Saccharicrinis aurantiacus TaxID=1849719 RepID=UPI000839848F|nr:tetratricopeptide repeat protein [Saccharicrinis aurantiacus]